MVMSRHGPTRTTATWPASVLSLSQGCDYFQQMDVVFLLDSRTSASNFGRMRDFVREVVDCPVNSAICGLNMTAGSIRVAVYQYWGNQVRADIALHHYSQQHDVRSPGTRNLGVVCEW